MSDGTMIENPKFLANTSAKIRKASKQKRRKQAPNFKKKIKASKRWKKANKQVANLVRKASNQRQDWVHKQAAQIVFCNSMVATEKLSIRNVTRKLSNHLRLVLIAVINRKKNLVSVSTNALSVVILQTEMLLPLKLCSIGHWG
jgi:putative transposase